MCEKISTLVVLLLNVFGAQCLTENCGKNVDCTTTNSICVNQKCECDPLATQVGSQCLLYVTKYKGYCQDDQQCEWLGQHSGCRKGRCQCHENYRWYKGKCRQYAGKGQKCGPGIDCYSGFDYLSLKCSNQTCTCNDGYYDRGLDCRFISKMNSACAIDLDCQDDELTCKKIKCVSKTKSLKHTEAIHFVKSTRKYKEEIRNYNTTNSCNFDDDCSAIENSYCDVTNGNCICLPETYFSQDRCLPGIGPCKTDADCSAISNAMCFKGRSCICKPGYYLEDGKCYPELGVQDLSLNTVRDCQIKPAQLINHTCYCQNYWFNDDSNQNCIKTTAQQFNNCPTGSDSCNALGLYSYCDSGSHTCSCNAYAKFNNKTYFCDKIGDLPKGSCLRDNDCDLNERCNEVKCECIEKFTRNENGTCLPDIGGSCEVTSCSHIGNAKCAGGICECYTNMSYVDIIQKCVKVVHNLNEECDYTEQCIYLKNTVCDSRKGTNDTVRRCICGPDYLQIKEECLHKKQYGDPCMTSLDCTLVLDNSFECRNSMCQCPTGFMLKNDYCHPSAGSRVLAGQWTVLFLSCITIIREINTHRIFG